MSEENNTLRVLTLDKKIKTAAYLLTWSINFEVLADVKVFDSVLSAKIKLPK